MNDKDAVVIKVLTELELRPAQSLTPEQEGMLRRALDPEEEFAYVVEKIFAPKRPTRNP